MPATDSQQRALEAQGDESVHKHPSPKLTAKRLQRRYERLVNERLSNVLFTEEQNKALTSHLNHLSSINFSVTQSDIQDVANGILRRSHRDPSTPPQTVCTYWVRQWLKKHPEYKHLIQNPIGYLRKEGQNPRTIQGWYNRLEAMMRELEIQHSDIWSCDIPGVRICATISQHVDSELVSYLSNSKSRAVMTLVQAVSAAGNFISPLVVAHEKSFVDKWVKGLPDDYCYSSSDTGFMDAGLGLQWLQHFDRQTRQRTERRWRLLIINGYGSHCTQEFIQCAEDNCIKLWGVPLHTSHFLQPLEVGCWTQLRASFTRVLRQQLDLLIHQRYLEFVNVDFPAYLHSIRVQALEPANILSGFCQTGIFPWNPALVINDLTTKESACGGAITNADGSSSMETPKYVLLAKYSLSLVPSRTSSDNDDPYSKQLVTLELSILNR